VAKKQQRSNREKRKKADKPKPSAQILPFAPAQGLGALRSGAT
jgi:hypothetical protein